MNNPFKNALNQLDKALKYLELTSDQIERLRNPEKIISVNFPVEVDVKKLSEKELENLSRAYVAAIANDIGPQLDVPAPDVNTTPQIMGWMTDEFIKIRSKQ